MQKIFLIILCAILATGMQAQKCDKGCGKITKTEPTTNKKIKPNRALLNFKFVGPTGKPATKWVKIVVDNDTVVPVLDKNGATKITSTPGPHTLKFKAPWWYTVSMNQVMLKDKTTYHILVKFEAEEIIGGTRKKDKN